MSVLGAVVVVAKVPKAGSSKTRLSSILGIEGAADIARSMLCDVLAGVSSHTGLDNALKILLYAPGDDEGEHQMASILDSLGLNWQRQRRRNSLTKEDDNDEDFGRGQILLENWILFPMIRHGAKLTGSNLGVKLADALEQARSLLVEVTHGKGDDGCSCPVAFLGMDAPELPPGEVASALHLASCDKKAYICPAADGGYGMLCLPSHAPPEVFDGVRWSDQLTAVSQMKALTDAGVDVILGKLVNDIDEPNDLRDLGLRLLKRRELRHGLLEEEEDKGRLCDDVLLKFPPKAGVRVIEWPCPHTWKALQQLGIEMIIGKAGES